MKWILSVRVALATVSSWCYSLLLGLMIICPKPVHAAEQQRETHRAPKGDLSVTAPVDPHQSSILGELRAFREDVRSVRRDVNRLIELLENRQGARDRSKQEEVSGARSDSVDRDVPARSWAMTLREAITIALQNSKTVTVASAGSTPQESIAIRRKNASISLTDAKDKVGRLVKDVEQAYWDLWLAYRNLETVKQARDGWLESRRRIASDSASSADIERDAREQAFLSRDTVEDASHSVDDGERRLRFLLGLSGDGRLIRPSEAPSLTKPRLDWTKIQAETLENSPLIARQRWELRRSELELNAAKAALARNGQLQPAQNPPRQ